jgi:hypothetical protein
MRTGSSPAAAIGYAAARPGSLPRHGHPLHPHHSASENAGTARLRRPAGHPEKPARLYLCPDQAATGQSYEHTWDVDREKRNTQ